MKKQNNKKDEPKSLREEHGALAIPILQGAMQARAEELYPGVSKRFTFEPEEGRPRVIIHDLVTGTEIRVGLCDYHGALKVLQWLFPNTNDKN